MFVNGYDARQTPLRSPCIRHITLTGGRSQYLWSQMRRIASKRHVWEIAHWQVIIVRLDGKTKVTHFQQTISGHQHIVQLHVAVYNSMYCQKVGSLSKLFAPIQEHLKLHSNADGRQSTKLVRKWLKHNWYWWKSITLQYVLIDNLSYLAMNDKFHICTHWCISVERWPSSAGSHGQP